MAKKATKPLDLVAACKEIHGYRVGWLKKVTPEQRGELERLRAAVHSGDVVATTDGIRRKLESLFDIKIDPGSFRRWLTDGRPTKDV